MKRTLKTVLIWIWCFPQMLLGFLVRLFTKAEKQNTHYNYKVPGGSVSLGTYIFLSEGSWDDETMLKHEQGHTKQSFILGWLYLLVIGLPSIIWNSCFEGYRQRKGVSYYSFFTERWADKLSGIDRHES